MPSAQLCPTVDAFVDALQSLRPLAKHHREILAHHYNAPEHTATATQLADAMGYENYRAINLHYGKFSVLLCEKLGLKPSFMVFLAGAEPNDENGQLDLVLRPELADAINRTDILEHNNVTTA